LGLLNALGINFCKCSSSAASVVGKKKKYAGFMSAAAADVEPKGHAMALSSARNSENTCAFGTAGMSAGSLHPLSIAMMVLFWLTLMFLMSCRTSRGAWSGVVIAPRRPANALLLLTVFSATVRPHLTLP
jgi:hypothetical protein